MKGYILQRPYKGRAHQGCLCCPVPSKKLSMRSRIAVGFGMAGLTKNGQVLWMENNHEFFECLTVMKAENMARKDPNNDWRIVMDGPLHGETYQRQGKNNWVMIESNRGFA